MKIKYSFKNNKKLLLYYNNFIKNCSLLKDNTKDISNNNKFIFFFIYLNIKEDDF